MGDGRTFLKTGRDTFLIKIYRMSLILTGSISLDSTFNAKYKNNSNYLILPKAAICAQVALFFYKQVS